MKAMKAVLSTSTGWPVLITNVRSGQIIISDNRPVIQSDHKVEEVGFPQVCWGLLLKVGSANARRSKKKKDMFYFCEARDQM